MSYHIISDKIKRIEAGEPDFRFSHDGISFTPRAAIKISESCPFESRLMIESMLAKGYLKPVAYMKNSEYMWEQLQK